MENSDMDKMVQTRAEELGKERIKRMIDESVRRQSLPGLAIRLGGPHGETPGGISGLLADVRRVSMGMEPLASKDMNATADASGGYLVSGQQFDEILAKVSDQSVMMRLCRVVPMTSASMTFPTLEQGLSAVWVPEATDSAGAAVDGTGQADGEIVASDPTMGQLTLTCHTLAAKLVISNDLLMDSSPRTQAFLMQQLAGALGAALDKAILRGGGTTTDPITGLAGLITSNALSVSGTFSFDDALGMLYAVRANAPFAEAVPIIGHPLAERQLMGLKDSAGNYIYRGPDQPGGRPTIWGEEFVRNPYILTNLGDDSDQTRMFAGDFAGSALIGLRAGLEIRSNIWAEPYFSYNQTAFIAKMRVGFAVVDEKRFAMLSGVPTA